MRLNDEIFRKSIETALNHKARAAEGKKLLSEGKDLGKWKHQFLVWIMMSY